MPSSASQSAERLKVSDECTDRLPGRHSAGFVDNAFGSNDRWYALENLKKFPFTLGRKGAANGFGKDFENNQPPE